MDITIEWTQVLDQQRWFAQFPAFDGAFCQSVTLRVGKGYGRADTFYWEFQHDGVIESSALAVASLDEARARVVEAWRTWARAIAEAAGWAIGEGAIIHHIVRENEIATRDSVTETLRELARGPDRRGTGLTAAQLRDVNTRGARLIFPDLTEDDRLAGYVDLGRIDPAHPPTCMHGNGPDCVCCQEEDLA